MHPNSYPESCVGFNREYAFSYESRDRPRNDHWRPLNRDRKWTNISGYFGKMARFLWILARRRSKKGGKQGFGARGRGHEQHDSEFSAVMSYSFGKYLTLLSGHKIRSLSSNKCLSQARPDECRSEKLKK
jgi:hypothetical protein